MTKITHLSLDERGGLAHRGIHLGEPAGDFDVPLETVGQDLRAARLNRGDGLAAVSRALKIRKEHIEAIEGNRLEALPGRTYAVGFVRSYAEYLGLDVAKCVERFKGEIAGRSDGSPQVGLPPDSADGRLPRGWIVVAVVVLAVVAYAVFQLARSAVTLSPAPVAAVPARMVPAPAVAPITPPPVVARSKTRPGAVPAIVGNAAQTQIRAAAPISTGAKAASSPDNVGQSAPAADKAQVAPRPPGQEFGAQNRDARVILRARSPTHILVEGPDGNVYIDRILQPGDSYRVPDLAGLSLTTADGGSIAVELDGQNMGAAGRAGRTTGALSLDPQAIVDRYNGGSPG